jgi:hypothetical protein
MQGITMKYENGDTVNAKYFYGDENHWVRHVYYAEFKGQILRTTSWYPMVNEVVARNVAQAINDLAK